MTNHRVSALSVLAVCVTLGVCPASAQGASITRVEQDDPSITYSGNWYSNDSALHSRDVAALTNAPGARATITFTGTGIAWIGVMDGWAGLANVYVDGTLTVIDSYADPARYQHAIHRVTGLPSRVHTLSIEVTHERAGKTDGSWVWVDAFDIENGAGVPGGSTAGAGRVEEDHAGLVFTGRWYANASPAHSGGHAVLATDAGSRATINFNGSGVSWIAYRDEWSGMARVYVDGQLKTTIDNYLSPAQARSMLYAITGLPFGTHALTIEATGTRNASAQGAWIWLDAFEVVP